MDKKEFLTIGLADAELRATDDEKPMLVGYASRFNTWYPVGDFLERIVPGAFDAVLLDTESDVVASMNHNFDLAFARQSAGTLRLKSNSIGLQYEADITDAGGRLVWEKIKARTIQGSSFMFSDASSSWEWPQNELPRRTITRVGKLYELGPVVWPANAQATVQARRCAEILAEARARYGQPPGILSIPEAELATDAEVTAIWSTIDSIREYVESPDV